MIKIPEILGIYVYSLNIDFTLIYIASELFLCDKIQIKLKPSEYWIERIHLKFLNDQNESLELLNYGRDYLTKCIHFLKFLKLILCFFFQ